MKPELIFVKSDNETVHMTKEEFKELFYKAYQAGVNDGIEVMGKSSIYTCELNNKSNSNKVDGIPF